MWRAALLSALTPLLCWLQAWQHQQQQEQQQAPQQHQQQQQQQMQSAASGGIQYPMYAPQPQQLYSGYGQYAAPMTYQNPAEYPVNGQLQAPQQQQHQQPPPPPPQQQYQQQQPTLQPPPYVVPTQSFPQYNAGPPPPSMAQYAPQGGAMYATYPGGSQPGGDLVMGYPHTSAPSYAGGYPGMASVPPPQPMGAPPPYRPIGVGAGAGPHAQQAALTPPPVPVKRPITIQAPPGSGAERHDGAGPVGAVGSVANGQSAGGGKEVFRDDWQPAVMCCIQTSHVGSGRDGPSALIR